MIIDTGDKVHVVYRAFYENSVRRHFLGEVTACKGALCRLRGFSFVRDSQSEMYTKKPEKHITIIDLAESGYIVTLIDSNVDLDQVSYHYLDNTGMAAVDGQGFVLDINEFGPKS
ncbi:MAG: hypothetical protein HKN42_13940 [Granulosicoccus sp.]|nr:hypothetical protein [Granulosicoccus sp.]